MEQKRNLVVHKYLLPDRSGEALKLPIDAQILSVDLQTDNIFLWALVDKDAEKEDRFFEIYGTGHVMEDLPRRFLNTFFNASKLLVFHAFELIKN